MITRTLLVLSLFVSVVPLRADGLISSQVTEQTLEQSLLPAAAWKPYPKASDRAAWNKAPEVIRQRVVEEAAKLAGTQWPALPASVFLEYVRNGNRTNFERLRNDRRLKLGTLVMAEVFENKGRFLDDIANGLWATCEETYWGLPAHVGVQKRGSGLPDVKEPTVDLFAAETASLLAWTHYLLGDELKAVSPLLPERIAIEIDRRVLTPCLERDDFWWMGLGSRTDLNNWTPWICSNWLTSTLLIETNEAKRRQSIVKNARCLDNFLAGYGEDGGCDEGPGYWGRAGASLFDCLELLNSSTGGKVDVYRKPLIRNIARYIYRVYIAGDYFVNFADASAKAAPEPGLVYRFGKRIDDPGMTGFGAFLAQRDPNTLRNSRPGSLGRFLADLFSASDLATAKPQEPFLGEAWLPDVQVMAARSFPGTSRGFYLAAQGGHNAESHNHNDVGNFIVFADGRPVLIDVGVESYTAKTFSSRRYEIWTMQSAFHNAPTINGVQQKDGREFRAKDVSFSADGSRVIFQLDLVSAYPADAQIGKWSRTLTLFRGTGIELREDYQLTKWIAPFELNFMTTLWVTTGQPGTVLLAESASGKPIYAVTYDPGKFEARAEEIPIQDSRLKGAWGDRVARIILKSKEQVTSGSHRVAIDYIEKNDR
ncbi:MAG: hypothetical protein EHM61_19125 [Acidobacteria bacterium]|nr:MAG: hypothetical protein EHM61_19125 [Acidobacteriota bacterium]